MPIIRAVHNRDNPYTKVSNRIVDDPRLRLVDRGVLLLLLSCADSWEFNEIGLSKRFNIGRAQLRESLKRLEEFGYIEREHGKFRDENNRWTNKNWTVYEHPRDSFASPCSKSVYGKQPMYENTISGNRPQTINKEQVVGMERSANNSWDETSIPISSQIERYRPERTIQVDTKEGKRNWSITEELCPACTSKMLTNASFEYQCSKCGSYFSGLSELSRAQLNASHQNDLFYF